MCVYPNYYKKKFTFFFTESKNEHGENKIWWQKNKKSGFYNNINPFHIEDIDVNKILVSKKKPYGQKND